MNTKYKIKITCKSVLYHSPVDEECFFQWLEKIISIKHIDGVRDELYLYFESSDIPDQDLRELLSFFYRYKIKNMNQLSLFLNDKNKKWFYEKPKGYWHKKVFGSDKK